MGDELQRQQQQAQLPNEYQIIPQDTSTPSLTNTSGQQPALQNMDIEQYPQQHFLAGSHPGVASLDMRSLVGALPAFQQQSFQPQYSSQFVSNQPAQYSFQQGQQFAGQTAGALPPNFIQQYPQQYYPSHPRPNQQSFHSVQTVPQNFQNQAFQMQQGMATSGQQFLSPPPYGARVGQYQGQQLRVNPVPGMPMYQQPQPQLVRRTSSNSSLQASVLRGPPRKPKQSGHALWVGNLPPGTHIIDLKDHFSRDATSDIESVFLISKSNCAFVNYKSEASCAAAMSRFHDSRFQGVRLVCRLRRGSNSGPGTPQATSSAQNALQPSGATSSDVPGEPPATEQPENSTESTVVDVEASEKVKEKFFVVKSLTVEDLERSVASGVWATQAHNEDVLNKAYQSAESVYLIFSANKSGEYFGYARMDSAIDDEASAKLEAPIRPESSVEPPTSDLPLTIPTPATASAPKGRIIDDSARGTIFWEADSEEKDEEDSGNISGEGYESGISTGASPARSQTFGKPFKIVWVSTERLPFYRTRGLRNPWNANREVKIARDGTEIEPSVGRRLTSMFHRPQGASSSPLNARQPSGAVPLPQGYMPQQGQMPGNPYGRSY